MTLNPAIISGGLFIIQEAIKYEPALVEEFRNLFASGQPTEADWQALHDRIASKSYRDYVPASALPAP